MFEKTSFTWGLFANPYVDSELIRSTNALSHFQVVTLTLPGILLTFRIYYSNNNNIFAMIPITVTTIPT